MMQSGRYIGAWAVLLLLGVMLSGSAAPGLFSLIETDRPEHKDVIYFRNGDVLRGEVLNESLSIITPYALIALPLRTCAGVSFQDSGSNSKTLITVNFNRITGTFVDRTIRFQSSLSKTPAEIRIEKINRILLHRTPGEKRSLDSHAETDLFVMTNGDLLTGKPETRHLTLRVDGKQVKVPFSEAESIEITRESSTRASVTKKNDALLKGTLETEEIGLKLDVGVKVPDIYVDQFSRIITDDGNREVSALLKESEILGQQPVGSRTAGKSETYISNAIGIKFRLVEPGIFWMGSEKGNIDEGPRRKITLTRKYYLSVFEVTQEQWILVMGGNPAYFKDPLRPVEMVSWNDAQEFCHKLSEMDSAEYRLPTEAEWAFACRAGTSTEYPWGNDFTTDYAWCSVNSEGETAIAGSRKPNPWGFHDMIGNVWEWCEDSYAPYNDKKSTDPLAANGSDRVLRGGGWFNVPERCRSASRDYRAPDYRTSSYIGFRVVRNP